MISEVAPDDEAERRRLFGGVGEGVFVGALVLFFVAHGIPVSLFAAGLSTAVPAHDTAYRHHEFGSC